MPERTDDFVPGDDIELARNDDERSEADNAAELRAEIRETRERMGDSLEQLGERLNPGNIKDRVKQDIRDATIGKVENMAHSAADQLDEARQTIGDAQRTVVDVVRDNPIPAAMVGIGLGWIAYNVRQRGSRGSRSDRVTPPRPGPRLEFAGVAFRIQRGRLDANKVGVRPVPETS